MMDPKTDLGKILRLRAVLASITIATCDDCEEPINALDPACPQFVLHPDGECEVIWYHAACIGCYQTEEIRQSAEGCSACARECHVTPK